MVIYIGLLEEFVGGLLVLHGVVNKDSATADTGLLAMTAGVFTLWYSVSSIKSAHEHIQKASEERMNQAKSNIHTN